MRYWLTFQTSLKHEVDSSDIESMLSAMDFSAAFIEDEDNSSNPLRLCWDAMATLVESITKELEELRSITTEVESILSCERDYSQENLVTYIEVLARKNFHYFPG